MVSGWHLALKNSGLTKSMHPVRLQITTVNIQFCFPPAHFMSLFRVIGSVNITGANGILLGTLRRERPRQGSAFASVQVGVCKYHIVFSLSQHSLTTCKTQDDDGSCVCSYQQS